MRYRLQFFDRSKTTLAINWAHRRANYVRGDFYVRAIKEITDVDAHNASHFQKQLYTTPFALNPARDFIKAFVVQEVHDCVGLTLEDEKGKVVEFDKPIHFRNMSSLAITPMKEIDATAIRYSTWVEDTYHLLKIVWGEEKAKLKLRDYQPPQELLDKLSLEELWRKR